MPNTEIVVCELCGSNQAQELFVGADRLLGVPGEFRVQQCTACGLIYTNPRPTSEAIRDYYPDTYGVYAPEGGQAVRLSIYHQRLARKLSRIKTSQRRVLDIGCGDGAFLTEMKALGWQCKGLEMDEKAAKRARDERGLDIVNSTIEGARFESGSFDLIVLSHVLEHVPHPRQALRWVREWLTDDGYLFVTLPNVDSWERRRFGKDWYPWDIPRHFTHFSPSTLSKLMAEEGFKPLSTQFLTAFYFPQSMRYRRQAIMSPVTSTASAKSPKEMIKTFVFMSLLTIGAIAGKAIHGEIMEVIARKSTQ
jgi:2-polyprenyl-3-methyl-5-hydroxy-6-metoxy-1,4-benzoquinol methylase